MSQQIKVIIQRSDLYSEDYSNIIVNNKECGNVAIKKSLIELILKFIKEVH